MKALLTGASGFCGRHLSRYLREQGLNVFSLSPNPGKENHFQIESVRDVEGMKAALHQVIPDFVFHLAGISNAKDPRLMHEVNTEYGICLLNALSLVGLRKTVVLLVGSAAEYGTVPEKDLPASEDLCPRPTTQYGVSKLAQTLVGLIVAKEGRPLVIVRPANIIGPELPESLVVGSLVKQIHEIVKEDRDPIIEVGNIETSRDFIDVYDVVAIYWKLVQTPAAYGQIVNVCTGQPISLHSLIEKMIALSGKQIRVVSNPHRFKLEDPPIHYGSTEKLRRLLGYVPSLDLDRSLNFISHAATKES